MSLSKPERRIAIWVGVIIGVTVSSMLFKYAIREKNERSSQRIGSYDSNFTAVLRQKFPPVPKEIRENFPNGLVLYHESNQTLFPDTESKNEDYWIIETTGAFRSERLFILARIRPHAQKQTEAKFYRASELYFTLSSASDPQELKDFLPENEFRIIGRNSKSEELIIQTKNFTPKRLKEILTKLPKETPVIESIRLVEFVQNK